MATAYEIEQAKTAGVPRSPHWSAVRAAWLKEHPACRACGGLEGVEVHHKVPFHLDPAKELDPTNLISLCEKSGRCCHYRVGHGYSWACFNREVEADATAALARATAIRKDMLAIGD